MNNRSNSCPFCGSSLLRHIRHQGIYWFCSSCHQEVPSLTSMVMSRRDKVGQQSRPLTAVGS
ncbi:MULTISPECIES: hypothetical protein [Floridanema]|uniref:Uncharacterized protein n=2 Tax=Floridanema TaxID=3396149 RepID=A0ABV4XKA3_9CYAN